MASNGSLRVRRCEDGIYRWSYDMDMWRNRFLIKLALKIVCLIFAIPILFLLAMIAMEALPDIQSGTAWASVLFFIEDDLEILIIVCAVFVGIVALSIVIYVICALIRGGRYQLCFEMSESYVRLVRSLKEKKVNEALETALWAASIMTDDSNHIHTDANVGTTSFASVTKVKLYPKYDVIHLREWFGLNQIYVCPEDYPFVRDFICAHVREKAKK